MLLKIKVTLRLHILLGVYVVYFNSHVTNIPMFQVSNKTIREVREIWRNLTIKTIKQS